MKPNLPIPKDFDPEDPHGPIRPYFDPYGGAFKPKGGRYGPLDGP